MPMVKRFNAFLTVSSDDIVTAIIAQTEGGQGNSTGMPQVIAAELGADWDKMRVQFSTERRQEFINTKLYKGSGPHCRQQLGNPLLRADA